jgi:hypothetical protein
MSSATTATEPGQFEPANDGTHAGQIEALGLSPPVVTGLVPANPIILALCLNVRDRRDKPGDDEFRHQMFRLSGLEPDERR